MNQDEQSAFNSDDTSDEASSYLNNSLSEGDFAIESSNLDSGGLKFTILCRRKSSDNDVDDSRTNMSQEPPSSNDQCTKASAEQICQVNLIKIY